MKGEAVGLGGMKSRGDGLDRQSFHSLFLFFRLREGI